MILTRRALHAHALAILSTAATIPAFGRSLDYGLRPQPLSDGMWLLRGLDEHLSTKNGGNIANVLFMTTGDGVLVFDTGPSKIYGEQLRQAIALTTSEPIRQVMVSHAHPDHYLGNQAFNDIPIAGLAGSIETINQIGEAFTDNMYRLVDFWMKGTRTVAPTLAIAAGPIRIGNRTLEVIELDGHTDADMALFDHQTGTLIGGDLVFMNRAPTTPQADLVQWAGALDELQKLPIKQVVPGHGPVTSGVAAIEQTRYYLTWLGNKLTDAAEEGLTPIDVMSLPIDKSVANLAIVEEEFVRSVSHLYGYYQLEALRRI